MSQKSNSQKPSSERLVKDIRGATRRQYSAEEKIRIVLDGLRGERSIAALCRRERRDHPPGRAIAFASAQDAGKARRLSRHFYRWCDLYQTGGLEALEDRSPKPSRVCNRIPDDRRDEIVQLAHDEPELSPRELAARFIDTKSYFVSEASIYRLLKAHDLIASPAFIVVKAADEFKDKTTAPNSSGRPTSPISR